MTRLSHLQFPMLEQMATGVYLSISEAQHYDQRPFRSMLVRGWVAYKPGRGFHITPEGRQAHEEFHNSSIERKNPTMPLTAYFDPTAYGLHIPQKAAARVHVIAAKRGAAWSRMMTQ